MKCPYCGNDDPATFLYPDDDDGPYVICLACNGEFEEGEVEYYEAQGEEESEEDLGPFPETSIRLDDLPKTLRWLRKMREMTLKQVGGKSGLSVSFLSDMERGRVRPSLETLQKLAVVYKTPLSIYLPSDPTAVISQEEELDKAGDKLISLSAITQALEKEIQWCKDNQDQAPGDSGVWFIKGLEQAKWLIAELSKVDYQESPTEPDSSKKKSSQVSFAFGEGGNLENMTDENYGFPGWMGDYGGSPFGPVDL